MMKAKHRRHITLEQQEAAEQAQILVWDTRNMISHCEPIGGLRETLPSVERKLGEIAMLLHEAGFPIVALPDETKVKEPPNGK